MVLGHLRVALLFPAVENTARHPPRRDREFPYALQAKRVDAPCVASIRDLRPHKERRARSATRSEQQVTNQVVDMGLLTQTPEPTGDLFDVETIGVVANKGYFKIEDIEACEKAGMVPYEPRPQRGPSVRAGLFRRDVICPAGPRLYPYRSSLMRGLRTKPCWIGSRLTWRSVQAFSISAESRSSTRSGL